MSPIHLSNTAHAVLTTAVVKPDHAVALPERLPIAARRAVVKSMLTAGLLEEAPAVDGQLPWRTTEDGERFVLRATEAGLAAVSSSQTTADAGVSAGDGPVLPTTAAPAQAALVSPRMRLRAAAEAAVASWGGGTSATLKLADAMETLRHALSTLKPALSDAPRKPRIGTKQQAVLALLRRSEGATVAQVAEATGWANHTVRGFFAGLKKKGIMVDVLERVRQVGPDKEGARGSYTIYHVAEAG